MTILHTEISKLNIQYLHEIMFTEIYYSVVEETLRKR